MIDLDVVDIFLTPTNVCWLISYDSKGKLTLSSYKALRQAVAQLRDTLRGPGRMVIDYENKICQRLAERLGLVKIHGGLQGWVYELPDHVKH